MQLVNIIRGDISIVGPRPERPEIIKDLIPEIKNYNLRHIIKPGITGWAQINYKYGNSVEDSKQKFEYDLYYIKNRNIFMDIGIVIRTVQKIFN
jgi:lipopolysaccharide/colanic/teichoic acid biosynthesis glycosyltransferase